MKTVILIGGRPRHGKDTHANYLAEKLGVSTRIISFAQPGKKILLDLGLITLDPALKEIERPLMRNFMNDICKANLGDDIWVNTAINTINNSEETYFIIPDWRFHVELDRLIEEGYAVYTFYVTRPDCEVQDKAKEENSLSPQAADINLINTDMDSVLANVDLMVREVTNAS